MGAFDVTVITGTFGAASWGELAHRRAAPSVPDGTPWVHRHGVTLAQARNEALAEVETEFVIHLDADDQLASPGYIEAMSEGTADLRAPRRRQVQGDHATEPSMPRVRGHDHDCTGDCLKDGNFICIGAAVRTELLRTVGGWWEEPIYEDWSAFLRCYLAGGTVEAIPDAIYRVHGGPRGGRHRSLSPDERTECHHRILDAAGLGPL